MKRTHLLLILSLVLSYLNIVNSIEPLTIGGTIGLGAVAYNLVKRYTYCRYNECCDENYIPANLNELETGLKQTLYGQHIVLQHIVPALRAHFDAQNHSRKPLVLSFHGTPGTGKNFVADQIAKALYKNGLKSKYVRKYMGRADFPESSRTDLYKERINREVRESIRECPRSLFIFDEVDKMPGGVFDALTSLVDYNAYVDGSDNTKSIFIFLSNTAGAHIADYLGKTITSGLLRDDTRLSDFESLLQRAAYNLDGGLKHTSLIEAHVIDHYLPFLPLEKSHIIQCLLAEFRRWNSEPQQEVIDEITSVITYDKQYSIFASSGCKTLEKKVAVAVKRT